MGFDSEFRADIDPLIDAALSDEVSYIKVGHPPVTVNGYFNTEPLDDFNVSGYEPTFKCAASLIPNVKRDDKIIYESVTYSVAEVIPVADRNILLSLTI